ncbi:MAG TPA: hypothetical protein VJ789_05730 [Burkholderiales bacterium]|nr:hypothetical protein [Burkholderiales bacterium]
MLESGRYPTAEELDALIARARQMRAQYLGALVARAWQRLTQPAIGRDARHALAELISDAR